MDFELSVVIPTYSRKDILKKCIESFLNQSISEYKYEIIIIDDGSTDDTAEVVGHYSNKNLSYHRKNNAGPAAARNVGIQRAKGKLALIVNDDTIASRDLVEEHIKFHNQYPEEYLGVLGYVTWSPELKITPFMKWLENGGPQFSYNKIKGIEAGWQRFWTCNISLKTNFLMKNGLFDERFPTAAWEDIELGYRLSLKGFKLLYNSKAIAYHYHPTSFQSFKQRMIDHGLSGLIIASLAPEKVAPPLSRKRYQRFFHVIDWLFFPRTIVCILEKIACFLETRYTSSVIYQALIFHYKIEGQRCLLRNKKNENCYC